MVLGAVPYMAIYAFEHTYSRLVNLIKVPFFLCAKFQGVETVLFSSVVHCGVIFGEISTSITHARLVHTVVVLIRYTYIQYRYCTHILL